MTMHDVQDASLPSSIALAVTIVPSRRVRAFLGMATLVFIAAALFIHTHASCFALPGLLMALCGIAVALCAFAATQPFVTRQIDISKTGALRLTVQQNVPADGRAMRLLPGSVLWENLLVLRLGSPDVATSPVHTVLVLPDSTSRASFRALSVAMRALAGRDSAAAMQK